jgi:hypothetical protein
MISLPASFAPLVVPLCDMTGSRVLLEGSSGTVWIVNIGEGEPSLTPSLMVLPPSSREERVLHQFAGDRLLVTDDEAAYVFSLHTGQPILTLHNFTNPGEGFCLTPEATKLLAFRSDQTDFTSIYSLPDDQPRTITLGAAEQPDDNFRTTIFNYRDGERRLDSPESALLVPIPRLPGLHRLLIGCYGCVDDWTVALGSKPGDIQVMGEPRRVSGFVYDPVAVERCIAYPYVARMFKKRQCSRLRSIVHDLQRCVSSQYSVVRRVDNSHTAAADLIEHPVTGAVKSRSRFRTAARKSRRIAAR